MRKPFLLLGIFLFCIPVLPLYTAGYADALISPDDPRINYYGRFDVDTPSTPWHNWSGCAIKANLPEPLMMTTSLLHPSL